MNSAGTWRVRRATADKSARPTALAIGVRRVAGAEDDHRGAPVALGGKLGGVATNGSGFFRIDGRGVRPAALDIAEGVGAHAGCLAALWGQARLHEIREPVAERA